MKVGSAPLVLVFIFALLAMPVSARAQAGRVQKIGVLSALFGLTIPPSLLLRADQLIE